MSRLFRCFTKISDFGAVLAGLIILVSGFIVVYGVIVRYFFAHPAVWEIELASYLLIGATFAAAASGIHDDAHVSVDVITANIKERPKNILYIFGGIIGILFALAIAERSYLLWYEAYEAGWKSDSVWAPSLIYPYAIIPIGMLWFAIQYFIEVRSRFKQLVRSGNKEENYTEDPSLHSHEKGAL